MRDIKFEIWDVNGREMYKVLGINFDKGIAFIGGGRSLAIKDNILRQYMNKTDANNRPVYQYDILHCDVQSQFKKSTGIILIAQYNEGDAPSLCEIGFDDGLPITWGGFNSFKIIGNLCEDRLGDEAERCLDSIQ